jgi:hypothetical protein
MFQLHTSRKVAINLWVFPHRLVWVIGTVHVSKWCIHTYIYNNIYIYILDSQSNWSASTAAGRAHWFSAYGLCSVGCGQSWESCARWKCHNCSQVKPIACTIHIYLEYGNKKLLQLFLLFSWGSSTSKSLNPHTPGQLAFAYTVSAILFFWCVITLQWLVDRSSCTRS